MILEVKPQYLKRGMVLNDGFIVLRVSKPDYRNKVVVWGCDARGIRSLRELPIVFPVRVVCDDEV